MHDNKAEVNAWLQAVPERFREAMDDGVRQGVASALVAVHFWFPGSVNVHEVVRGFLVGVDPIDQAFLMPHLEDTTDAILSIVPLDEILRGLLLDR